MYAPAPRNDKTTTSSTDAFRFGARSATRNPPGTSMPFIAPPKDLLVLQRKIQNRPVETPRTLAPRTERLPATLKAGIESLSGLPMDDVRVHYNSDKPLQLQALAYTQGTEIHVAPGQEDHVPHEAWHAVQQKRDDVPATKQMNGVGVNDNEALEQEATNMANEAARGGTAGYAPPSYYDKRPVTRRSNVAPVVQRLSMKDIRDKWHNFDGKAFLKNLGTGALAGAGSVALGPFWDAGKAVRRRHEGGNLFFGSAEYRRYLRKYPGGGDKSKEYMSHDAMADAYGHGWRDTAPGFFRTINVLSAMCSDVARYAGWATGISGIIMVATGGTAAAALAPVATITASITAAGLAGKTGLASLLQAYLANRMDLMDIDNDKLRDEERHQRSNYAQGVVSSAAFAGMGLGAQALAGTKPADAWLQATGQTQASSTMPEVSAATGGDLFMSSAEAVTERTTAKDSHIIKPLKSPQRPKDVFGWHWLNPVYLIIRGLKKLYNIFWAIGNSLRGTETHQGAKSWSVKPSAGLDGKEGWMHRIGRAIFNFTRSSEDQRDGAFKKHADSEGYGHAAIRHIKNAFRGEGKHLDDKNVVDPQSPAGKGRTGLKHFLGALLGLGGGVIGGALGAVGGLLGGAGMGLYQGVKWGLGQSTGWRSGLAAIGGGLGGLFGGAIGGLGVGLMGGAALGATSGWDVGHGRDADISGKIQSGLEKLKAFSDKASNAWDELVAALTPAPDPNAGAGNAPPPVKVGNP